MTAETETGAPAVGVLPDTAALRALLLAADGEGCYLYALDPAEPDTTAHARFFNPVAGIVEDPATGTAAGPLACLLHRYGRAGAKAGHRTGAPTRPALTDRGDPRRRRPASGRPRGDQCHG